MTTDEICEFCRALPHVTEDVKWDDDLVFSIGGKMFCVAALRGEDFAGFGFKASPENFANLLDREGIIPAPYLARAQWVYVEKADALTLEEAKSLLSEARNIVISKMTKRAQSEYG
ncbi:MAG: MmcQ/YjbR family DNA-binding protein [Fimbriimonadaceae bacterium]